MKTKTQISILLLVLSYFLLAGTRSSITRQPSAPEADTIAQPFIIGAMHDGIDYDYSYISDSLGLNTFHKYTAPNWGWLQNNGSYVPQDILGGDTSVYGAYILQRLADNRTNKLSSLMDRPVLSYLCYGQSSNYQCEDSSKVDSLYKFYSYRNSRDNGTTITDIQDSGKWVKRCIYDRQNPGSNADTIVSGLITNREQANNFFGGGNMVGDSTYDWYIMPRIRIDSAFANNPLNQRVRICKIITTNWEGDTLTQIIEVQNFKSGLLNQYKGNYLSSFFSRDSNEITNLVVTNNLWFNNDPTRDPYNGQGCNIDFKVYWYNECDMWIDYVRVENKPARDLLTSVNTDYLDQLRYEVNTLALGSYDENSIYNPYNFYIEEFEFNHLPSIAAVSDSILRWTEGKIGLLANYNYDLVSASIRRNNDFVFDANDVKYYLVDYAKIRGVFTNSYCFGGFHISSDYHSYLPPTLNADYSPSNGILGYRAVSVKAYEDNLQTLIDATQPGSLSFRYILKLSNEVASASGIPFYHLMQTHSWWHTQHKLKEPTNEELNLMANMVISYGAKGIMYFMYDSFGSFSASENDQWGRGLTEPAVLPVHADPRYYNAYGQPKWDAIGGISERLSNWSDNLMQFEDSKTQSFAYRLTEERDLLSSNTVIKGLNAFRAFEFANDTLPDLANAVPDQSSELYLQAATFEKSAQGNDKSKYFMIINKRCSPFFDYTSSDNIGGRRIVTIKWNSSKLEGFNNWKLIDLNNDSCIRIIDRRDTNFMYLGDFLPGEGRLYKLAPVMQEGGTLIADEDCGGFEFECRGEVNNNRHDVTIVPNTTIVFANTSARIVMDSGSFHSGSSSESYPIYLNAKANGSWKGLKLVNCNEAELHQTHFSGVSPYPVDSTYAVELTDCSSINVSNCTFSSSSTGKTGSLFINYTSQGDPEDVYISSNTFNLNTGSMPAVSVIATGYDEVPMLMEWNEFESCSEYNTLAILLSNIAGGAVKENNFTGYDKTIFMLGSSMDVYGNYIVGSDQSSVGIVQHSASNANLSASGQMFTGGYNSITAEGQTAKCMELANSYLLIDEGYNTFRLEDSQTGNYHLEGTIPNDIGADPYPAENNCFQIGNGLLVKHNLRWIDETAINLDTVPSSCNAESPENLLVFDLGNGVSDTLHYSSGGSGSGAGKSTKEISKSALSPEESQTVSVKSMMDTVTMNLRKRNYEKVSASCRELLTAFADSTNDASLISKLYLAELKLDVSHAGLSELKSFLESYVLNNPEKEVMIRQAFYFIQKCKVTLGLYESALSGFQQIINQFPYSYEGLLASWDYAATSLLNSQGGSGGGEKSTSTPQAGSHDETEDYEDDPKDVYDNKQFSPHDRRTLNENLSKTFTTLTERQTLEIKILEEKMTKNEATDGEKKKYEEMKTLKEVVKARKPETVEMHLLMITDDLSRIMKSTGGNVSDKFEQNILPTEFALHQNYPNPFNPSTKITFDLPRDSRVTLIVYDLIGREVTRILSNELKAAGSYTYDFNGASLSSGVYFCRIQAGAFVGTKRMVLVK